MYLLFFCNPIKLIKKITRYIKNPKIHAGILKSVRELLHEVNELPHPLPNNSKYDK